jgi:hydrogenase small subunit
MAASGEKALSMLDPQKEFVLVAEGAFATKDDGIYCVIGEETALKRLTDLGKRAIAVIALGTCAAYGGIPAAGSNPTGAKGVKKIFDEYNISTPVINIPGCPAHPDWFVGTVAMILTSGLSSVELDDKGRPLAFFKHTIHDNCPRRGYYDIGKFAKKLSDPYCLYQLGCKGPITHADCPTRLWNGGTNWCIGAGHPCVGCVEPGFPDETSPFFRKVSLMNDALKNDVTEWIGKGLGIATLAGIGAHLGTTAASGRLSKKEEQGGKD